MKKLLIFAGTTEGRQLAERFRERYALTLRVATEYGCELAKDGAQCGRMSAEEMQVYLLKHHIDIVVDATHPYAKEVSCNIKKSCENTGTRCVRLLRQESMAEGCVRVDSARECAQYLRDLPGRVLLTTGSKELDVFTEVPGYSERLFVRVLPTKESVERAAALGYRTAHIIAMQGPFQKELNVALLRQFDIEILVTKDGGKEGGFAEKLAAAQEVGAKVVLISRPSEEGHSLDEVVRMLEAWA